jgi:hypothetical protein
MRVARALASVDRSTARGNRTGGYRQLDRRERFDRRPEHEVALTW